MAYEVITHGGGEGLVHTFNAISALFNGSKGFGSALVYIAGSFATAMAVMTLVVKQELLPSVKWFFGSLITMTALMTPKVDIIVKDRISQFQEPVANVPFMLGAFAGIASQLGDKLAKQFDSLFSRAGGEVMKYRHHGVAMASQLAAKAASFNLPNPDSAANVKAFVQNCMVFDIAKGKYSIEELLNAKDTWKFLADHASPIQGFPYRVAKKRTQIITCQEAVKGDDEAWRIYVNEAAHRYGSELFPHSRRPAQALLANLEVSYQYLTGLSNEAASILKQNLMRNLIQEGLLELNQIHDASAALTAYATSRAQAQQKTAYALQGNMASLSLSTLKIVVEVLFYAMFPMVVAIAVFPGGLSVIKKYLIALFWIQSWAPMYSILNMLVNVYGKAKSVAAVTLADGSKTLSFATIPRLGEANEWVAAVAGYAMMSVPFLSYGIIHYGAGALSQLATHFGSITQSSASHAAEEATTGNYHIGNTSFDNHSRSNVSAFKYDTKTAVAAGKISHQNLDGSISHHMPDGQMAYDMSPALPKLNSSIKMSDSLATSFNESANKSIQMAKQESQLASHNTTAALNKLNELRESRSKDTSHAESYSSQESSLKETAFGQYDDFVNKFAEENRINEETARTIFAEVSGGVKLPGVGGASAGIRGTHTNAEAQMLSKAQEYSQKHGMSELLKQARQEAKEGRLNFLNSDNHHYGDAISASLSKADSHIQSAQASLNEAEYYQEQASYIKQNGLSIDQDLTKQYWNDLVNRYEADKASAIVSDPVANYEHMRQFSSQRKEALLRQFEAQRPTNKAIIEEKYQTNQEEINNDGNIEKISNNNKEQVLAGRDSAGLNQPIDTSLKEEVNKKIESTEKEIEKQKTNLQEEAEKLKNKVSDKIPKTTEGDPRNPKASDFYTMVD